MKSILATVSLLALVAAPAFANDMDMAKMMTEKCMDMADTNKDGMVSKDENMAAAEKMMMMADTNKDGMVSKQEMMDMKTKEMKDMGMMSGDKMMMKKM